MTGKRKAYIWKDGEGKFCLSALPARVASRPFNRYDTQSEAAQVAAKRGMELVWEQQDGK